MKNTAIIYLTFSLFLFCNADRSEINSGEFPAPLKCSESLSPLTCEIHLIKSQLSRLELLQETTDLELYTKGTYIAKCEKKIEELTRTIHQLEADFSNIKDAPVPDDEEMIKVLEEQVQELEAVVRSSERDLQLLKVRTIDAENRANLLSSQVKTMASIVPELWFHVQKLEQANEVIERRTTELRRYMRNQKCLFFKFINSLFGRRCQEVVANYTSEALNKLGRSFSVIKKYHYLLQSFVKREMEKHDLIAVLAGEELVFFLASVIFVFPVMLAWICCQHSGDH